MRADSAGVTNDHALIAKEYWEEIGIEVEAEVIDTNIWRARVTKSKDWARHHSVARRLRLGPARPDAADRPARP